MGKGKADTLKVYINTIWNYKPKNKRVPCLKDWIEDDVKQNPKAWQKDPTRRLNNAVYSYSVTARNAEKKKKYGKTVGHNALVQNSNLLADYLIKDKKIPFEVRKSFVVKGVGIEAPQPRAPKSPLRKELLREAREVGVLQKPKRKQKRTKEEKREKYTKKFMQKHRV